MHAKTTALDWIRWGLTIGVIPWLLWVTLTIQKHETELRVVTETRFRGSDGAQLEARILAMLHEHERVGAHSGAQVRLDLIFATLEKIDARLDRQEREIKR